MFNDGLMPPCGMLTFEKPLPEKKPRIIRENPPYFREHPVKILGYLKRCVGMSADSSCLSMRAAVSLSQCL